MKKALLIFISIFLLSFQYNNNARINFYDGSYDNLLRKAKKTNSLIFLEFTAEWCNGCKKMQRETFTDPALVHYMNQNFLSYQIDVESFDGFEIANKFNVTAYPTYLILDPRAKRVLTLKGYYPPRYFAAEINKALREKSVPAPYIAANFAAY